MTSPNSPNINTPNYPNWTQYNKRWLLQILLIEILQIIQIKQALNKKKVILQKGTMISHSLKSMRDHQDMQLLPP